MNGLVRVGFATVGVIGGLGLAIGTGGTVVAAGGGFAIFRAIEEFQAGLQQFAEDKPEVRVYTAKVLDAATGNETASNWILGGLDFTVGGVTSVLKTRAALQASTRTAVMKAQTAVTTASGAPSSAAGDAAVDAVESAAKVGGRNIAPASTSGVHPGLIAAQSETATYESVLRNLRSTGTPEAHAVAKLLKRKAIEFLPTDPAGLEAAGRKPWFDNTIQIYLDRATTPYAGAGVAAHETKHWLQKITPQTYRRIHEFEAYQFQRRAGYLHLSDAEIWQFINTSPLYRDVSP